MRGTASPKRKRMVGAARAQRGRAVIEGMRNCVGTECLPTRTVASETDRSAAVGELRPATPAADAARVQEAVARINQTVQSLVTHLEFSIDTDTNRSVVKVVDNRSQEVLRQFPSEEVLQIAKALDNFTGLLLRDQA
jgi:flagellar protein FlaG